MAKLTQEALKTAVKSYVDATKQLNPTFEPTIDDFTKMVCKIGDQTTLYMPLVDKLPELAGSELPYGEIIEEFMVNDFLPSTFVYEDGAAKKNAPRPTFEQAVYSYPLPEQLFENGVPQTQLQRISLGADSYASILSSSIATMDSSTNAWNYAAKRQLLGNMGVKAIAAGLTEVVGDPATWTAEDGEAFIQKVLCDVEDASDMNAENLAKHTAAAAPSLKLYVSKKVVPGLKVKTLAGAFHQEELAIPAEIKTILDFGDTGAKEIVAILVDPRAVKLRDDINYTTSDYDGRQGVMNEFRHLKQTGFISKYGFVKVYTKA